MLYLASASPRRRELLTQAGFSFSVLPTNADESLPAGVTPREAVGILARRKAEAAVRMEEYRRQTAPGDVILAADTVVDLGGTIFGKPDSREDAARMLRVLSGKNPTALPERTCKRQKAGVRARRFGSASRTERSLYSVSATTRTIARASVSSS